MLARTPRYTYVEHEGGEKELDDLKEDSYQIDNLHETTDASLLNALRSRLDALKERGDRVSRGGVAKRKERRE